MLFTPSEDVRQAAVEQLVYAIGIDVAFVVDPQGHIAGDFVWLDPRLADRLFRNRSANSDRDNSSSCRTHDSSGEALVRAGGRKADDVAVRTGTAGHALAQLNQDAGASASG